MMMTVSTEIHVDDETRAALLLFNQRIEEARADERAAKRLAKAERAKTEAAAVVRELGNRSTATAEQKAEAEAAYKAAVDDFNRIAEDPHAEPDRVEATAGDPAPEPTEVSADEEPTESADEEPTSSIAAAESE